MPNFRTLRAWRASHELYTMITEWLPVRGFRRHPGLRLQIARCANSIPANLVEGCGKKTQREFLPFIDHAIGSANELEAHLLMARDGRAMPQKIFFRFTSRLTAVRKMLHPLRRAVEANAEKEEREKRKKRKKRKKPKSGDGSTDT